MQALMEANVAAERRGDLDAAMAFQTDDPELEIAGLHIRGHEEMRKFKALWIEHWMPRWKAQGWTIGMFDEEQQVAISESWVDNEMEDGSIERLRSVVVFEFEDGKMKRERLYCLDPVMMDVVRRTAGIA
jgi:ketosteroid isomerase-like protein